MQSANYAPARQLKYKNEYTETNICLFVLCFSWNIVVHQDNNLDSHGYRIRQNKIRTESNKRIHSRKLTLKLTH